ncbi:MAG: tyrosine-type recombinase/integrase [Acidimicrobiia bacterium]
MAPVHWYRSFRLALAAVGLPELHPHDLRHAAGTFFAQQGATTREIMARLGHRSRDAGWRRQALSVREAESGGFGGRPLTNRAGQAASGILDGYPGRHRMCHEQLFSRDASGHVR